MEARKITIASTKNQKKSVIMSAATTLAELKADLRQNGIDYDGMTFYEGTSKTELKVDTSILPHDVPYKGQTTNDLVFMLTNTNKKIKSGASTSRADAYAIIKANNLQEECIKRFGKNFTMCKTDDLITLINGKFTNSDPVEDTHVEEEEAAKTEKECCKKQVSVAKCVDTQARAALSSLLDILVDYDLIEISDKTGIENTIKGVVPPSITSPYSTNEIDDMFDFVR